MTPPYDTTHSPVETFGRALPYNARRALHVDHTVVAACRHLADTGADLTDVAARCAKGLERRARADVGRIVKYRLLRAAGMLDDTEGDAG